MDSQKIYLPAELTVLPEFLDEVKGVLPHGARRELKTSDLALSLNRGEWQPISGLRATAETKSSWATISAYSVISQI